VKSRDGNYPKHAHIVKALL